MLARQGELSITVIATGFGGEEELQQVHYYTLNVLRTHDSSQQEKAKAQQKKSKAAKAEEV
jgi:hypothetical protein